MSAIFDLPGFILIILYRKAQLAEELERLREQYQKLPGGGDLSTAASSPVIPTSVQERPDTWRSSDTRMTGTTSSTGPIPDQPQHPESTRSDPLLYAMMNPNSAILGQQPPLPNLQPLSQLTSGRCESHEPQARDIDGIEITSQAISECFSL